MFLMISGDHGSPMTSAVRAMEHAISPNWVRCILPAYQVGSLRERSCASVTNVSFFKEPIGGRPMNRPQVVSEQEWQVARDALLIKEKEATRALDALAAQRRRLPMVRLDAGKYTFTAPDGSPASLTDLFAGHQQL